MKIKFEDREWEFEVEKIDLKQGVAMHLAYGFTLDSWFKACADTDPRALQCLWWLILQQDGQVMPLKDANCSLVELAAAFADAQEAEDDEGEPEPDPTSLPSPPGGPPSPEPDTPTDTTQTPRARPGGGRSTASTPPI